MDSERHEFIKVSMATLFLYYECMCEYFNHIISDWVSHIFEFAAVYLMASGSSAISESTATTSTHQHCVLRTVQVWSMISTLPWALAVVRTHLVVTNLCLTAVHPVEGMRAVCFFTRMTLSSQQQVLTNIPAVYPLTITRLFLGTAGVWMIFNLTTF